MWKVQRTRKKVLSSHFVESSRPSLTTVRPNKKMYYPVLWPELKAMPLCLQSAGYKFCNLTSFILLRLKIKNFNNISLNL